MILSRRAALCVPFLVLSAQLLTAAEPPKSKLAVLESVGTGDHMGWAFSRRIAVSMARLFSRLLQSSR